jgi:hypothetical protein
MKKKLITLLGNVTKMPMHIRGKNALPNRFFLFIKIGEKHKLCKKLQINQKKEV